MVLTGVSNVSRNRMKWGKVAGDYPNSNARQFQ
jgi:hypothetical protein